MNSSDAILYAGYGANRDPLMIEAITGRAPKSLGDIAIQDFELCIQRLDQTPDSISEDAPASVSVREILKRNWDSGGGFETYTIRPKIGCTVSATLFELSTVERALIAEWELIEFGWYSRMRVRVQQENGSLISAETEGLRDGQQIDRIVNGTSYPTYVNDSTSMFAVAAKARREYFERQQS